jgi:arylsulfatase B
MTARCLTLWLFAGSVAFAADRPPNIVVLVADDLGYGELGCQGNREIATPHIDSLAAGGVRFTQGYVTAPVCSPSRAALLTGRYQTRFGHELNAIGKQNLEPAVGLPLAERTLAGELAAAGYATACIGKWHLGGTAKFHPQERGFGTFFGFLHEGHTFAPPYFPGLISHLRRNEPPYDEGNPLLRGTQAITEDAYLTDAIAREAAAFIDANAAQPAGRNTARPFLLYVPFNAVHSPMQTTPKYFDRFASIDNIHRRVFAAMLAALDDAVGVILARLRAHALEEQTLIFFLSDNGGPTAELTSSNLPLRGGKGQLYEGGIRVPFLVQWKGQVAAGRTIDRPVSSLDILPTALAAAGAKFAAGRRLDGVNLLPLLTGQTDEPPHRLLYWRMGSNYALRQEDWKLVRQVGRGQAPAKAELFDLARDPAETCDLAAERPQLAAELQAKWDALNREMVPPLWTPQRAAK